MRIEDHAYAGLIFPQDTGFRLAPYLDACQQVLARLDPRPVGVPRKSAKRSAVLGEYFGLRVTPERTPEGGSRLLFEIITRDGAEPDEEMAARILSDTVLAALEHSQAETIEWYNPDTRINAEDFIRLRSYVSPKRQPDRDAAQDRSAQAIEKLLDQEAQMESAEDAPQQDREHLEDEVLMQHLLEVNEAPAAPQSPPYNPLERMRARLAEQEADEMRMGAAGWAMSGVLAVVCFPAAIFVWIVSLFKGMDFRLTTQILSVTMLFVALTNSDRIHLMINQMLQ